MCFDRIDREDPSLFPTDEGLEIIGYANEDEAMPEAYELSDILSEDNEEWMLELESEMITALDAAIEAYLRRYSDLARSDDL